MELNILDVLEPIQAEELQSKIQYATLVKCFQNLKKSKVDRISRSGQKFIDLIIAACSQDNNFFNWASITPSDLRVKLFDAIGQKIAVGLIVMGKISLEKVSSEIFRAGKCFISEDVVRQICCSSPERFEVKLIGEKMFVQLASSPPKKISTIDEDGSSRNSDRQAAQLKHLYKVNPEVLPALRSYASYKNILAAFAYWRKYCGNPGIGFLNWLVQLATLDSPNHVDRYESNLNFIIIETMKKFIRSCGRTISQITDHLCIDKPGFITQEKVSQLIKTDGGTLFCITGSTKRLPIPFQYVVMSDEGRASLLHVDFDLLGTLKSRLTPLLSTRVLWESISNVFKIVTKTSRAKELIQKYGCFCKYLVEYAKAIKPKLDPIDYTRHLQSLLKAILLKTFDKRSSQGKYIHLLIEETELAGMVDEAFVREMAESYSYEFTFVGPRKIALCDMGSFNANENVGTKEYEPSPREADPLADLESPRVLHLLTKQPRFVDIFDVFITLPEISQSVLANNSMSFFEWLINMSKRLMPHDAPIFEAHLQYLVQQEASNLHSHQRCQMTIHHVHSQLCMKHPMLLSPNFLSWCLEQPKSPFTVHQSWIYLKNSIGRRMPDENGFDNNSTSYSCEPIQYQRYSPGAILDVVLSCDHLSSVIKAIKAIPLEHVGYIIQNNSYWFDYIENIIRDRKDRIKFFDIITDEAKLCLGNRILTMYELVALLSRGVANFVSAETLEYVLQQKRNTFALSGDEQNCHVGVVRHSGGDDIVCAEECEENLMRQILLYFPPSGSCDVSTLFGILCKEDSFLYKDDNSVNPDYLRCFFMMFPMLFYLREDAIVLTCMALDERGKYRKALYPTSTTGNEAGARTSFEKENDKYRKSRKRHIRSNHKGHGKSSKRRKRGRSAERLIFSPSEENAEINASNDLIVNDNDSLYFADELALSLPDKLPTSGDNLVVDEDSENSTLIDVINDLPACLLVDIATSLLLNNERKAKTRGFLVEVLRMTVASDESQRILDSAKLFATFKDKTFKALKENSKFDFLYADSDKTSIYEVNLKKEENIFVQKGSANVEEDKENDSQVKEVSSTSKTPERAEVNSEPTYQQSEISEDKEIASPHSTNNLDASDEIIKLTHSENNLIDSDISPISCTSSRKVSEDRSSIGSNDSEKTRIPHYAASSASGNYAKPKLQNYGRRDFSKNSREGQLLDFFQNYLEINAGTCATDLLFASAHRRFIGERFARSPLAFEAYSYDFTIQNCDLFMLSGSGCEFGVSKISRRGGALTPSPHADEPANLFFLKFVPDVCIACRSFLLTKPNKRSFLDDVCEAMNTEFQFHLGIFSDKEVAAVIRCLVLIALIRNLKLFCFAINEPVVYLRGQKESDPKSTYPQHKYKREVESILQNSSLTDAILLMADILRTCHPASQTALRALWQTRAPPSLSKVFGTGISFTLSLRKYSFVFPSSDNGIISVDEDVMKHIVRPIE